MELTLAITGIVIVLCVFINKLSSKVGLPVLLAFIFMGMAFGSDGIFRIQFEDYVVVEQISVMALIFIMFYGGFGTKWSEAKPVAVRSILMSTLGVVLTAVLVGLFANRVLGIGLYESLLIGAVLSPTDAASVFSILKSKQLNLKYKTASILELESGSNDPFAYMMTVIVLAIMMGSASFSEIGYMVIAQPVLGIVLGIVVARFSHRVLRNEFSTSGFDMAFTIGTVILSYALPTIIGGNGYLSVYITGIILGNSDIKNKKALVNFFDGFTSLMQMAIFFLLGLLSMPSNLVSVILYSIPIAAFLAFVARPLVVLAIFKATDAKRPQQVLLSWAGLRGASSIVFAIMVTISGVTIEHDIFHIVFLVVLLSIGIQGTLLPMVAEKLHMIDDTEDVLRTFTDYTEKYEVGFINLRVGKSHPWANKKVYELSLPPETIIVMVIRAEETIVPNGDTELLFGDRIILSAPGLHDESGIKLVEIRAKDKLDWCNRKISDIDIPSDTLVVMIKRQDSVVIPNGDTVILRDDILVMNEKSSLF